VAPPALAFSVSNPLVVSKQGGSSSASPAPPLLPGWTEKFSRKDGSAYWSNAETGESTRKRPVAEPASAAAPLKRSASAAALASVEASGPKAAAPPTTEATYKGRSRASSTTSATQRSSSAGKLSPPKE
jgi:hypothetical protein